MNVKPLIITPVNEHIVYPISEWQDALYEITVQQMLFGRCNYIMLENLVLVPVRPEVLYA